MGILDGISRRCMRFTMSLGLRGMSLSERLLR